MREKRDEFMKKQYFPEDACKDVRKTNREIKKDSMLYDLLLQAVDAYGKENCVFEDVLALCEEIGENSLIHEYSVNLLLFICLIPHLEARYERAGIGKDVLTATVSELKYKMIECKDRNNIWGIADKESVAGIFELKRFTLGRLQFEKVLFGAVMPGVEYKKDGLTLKPDTPVINVHVPRMLTALDKELLEESYAMAAEFFKEKHPVFIHTGWRIFPDYAPIIEGLDIRNFAEEYDIIATSVDRKGECPDMQDVFDMGFAGRVADYPENTMLRKRFKEYLINGGKTGRGIGIKVL